MTAPPAHPPTAAPSSDAPTALRDLLALLAERFAAGAGAAPPPGPAERGSAGHAAALDALRLALAALRQLRPPAVPHIAILGPTQTGKSTVTNLLLGAAAADASPLAGFTVHPQGFAVHAAEDALRDVAAWLGETRQRLPRGALRRETLDAFSLDPVPAAPPFDGPAAARGAVVWDTPDFDSLAAGAYSRGVLEIAALADVHVLVVSKEKYSDLAVWRMLSLLTPLRRPTLLVLNKVTPEAQAVIADVVRKRLAEHGRSADLTPLLVLPHDRALAAEPHGAAPAAEAGRAALRAAVQAVLAQRGAGRGAGCRALVRAHWAGWTAPARSEHAAEDAWRGLHRAAAAQLVGEYQREFLEHPHRYDTFRRAALELLYLLELPGVAKVVTQVRQVITWPARQALALGQAWFAPRGGAPRGDAEESVLREACAQLLTTLLRDVARRAAGGDDGAAFWRALLERLAQRETPLRDRFQQALAAHAEEVRRAVVAAGDELMTGLRARPALLHALRGARATADVASIALAIKAGGAPLHDLLMAPAVLALTSLLTEGALGSYMGRVLQQLRQRQLSAVQNGLVERVILPELDALVERLPGAQLIGVSRDSLAAAESALERWEPADA